MVLEKRFRAVPPQLLTVDGGSKGQVEVSDTTLFKVKQQVKLSGTGLDILELEVKRIENNTLMFLGPKGPNIREYSDVSLYTVSANSFIYSGEQQRPKIPFEEFMRAVYAEEPTVALRSFSVDKLGNPWTTSNPLPVQLSDGSVNIGTINAELEVQLSHRDDYPDAGDIHDSVRIGGISGSEADVTVDNRLKVSAVSSPSDDTKTAIICADDVHVDYTWAEIDGVRRITQILWSSADVASSLGVSEAKVERNYTYQNVDPFDLIDRDDALVLVP